MELLICSTYLATSLSAHIPLSPLSAVHSAYLFTGISMEPIWYTAVLFKSIMITSTKTGSESIYPPPGRHNLQNYTLLPDLKRKTEDLALLYHIYGNPVVFVHFMLCYWNQWPPKITYRKYMTHIKEQKSSKWCAIAWCIMKTSVSGNHVGHIWQPCSFPRFYVALFKFIPNNFCIDSVYKP